MHTYENRPTVRLDAHSGTRYFNTAAKIAAALGPDWFAETAPDSWGYAHLRNSRTGVTLLLMPERKPGWMALDDSDATHYKIVGKVWPGAYFYREESPTMRASATKSPERIAREIERRILAEAERLHRDAAEQIHGAALSDHEKWQATARLSTSYRGVSPLTDPYHARGAYAQPIGLKLGSVLENGAYGEIRFHRERSSLKLDNLTSAQVADILALFDRWNSDNG